jgi:exonuclease SbcD
MSIQIVHCSDLHLDKNFNIANLEKARIRKDDLNRAFSKVVDFVLNNKPDVFVISGDVFDKTSPTNAAIIFLTEQIKRIKDAQIPTFIIGGNHEVPKSGSFPPLAIDVLQSAGLATVFSRSDTPQKRLLKIGNETVCISGRSYYAQFDGYNPLKDIKIPLDGDRNILLIHGSLQGLSVAPSGNVLGELNPFSTNDIISGLDYLALGHFHNFFTREFRDCTITNPGSLEKLSYAERNDKKGFVWVELAGSETIVEQIEVSNRPMDERELSLSKDASYVPGINEHLIKELERFSNKNGLLKLNLRGQISLDQYNELRLNEVVGACKDKFFDLRITTDQLDIANYGRVLIGRVDDPIEAFRKRIDQLMSESSYDQSQWELLEQVKQLGIEYLERAG